MDWQKVKDKIYYWDGSWRDIYVLNTTKDDWQKWIQLVNQNYSVEFYDGQSDKTESTIDCDKVFNYLDGKIDYLCSATIKIEAVIVKCYFFADQEIENDIDPREIISMEDHNRLISYVVAVSKRLDKPVILTDENTQNVIHILVDGDNVKLSE